MTNQAETKPKRRGAAGDPKACGRSKVSNGKALFLDMTQVDGRSVIARRFRDHMDDLTAQVGGDPSPGQDMLIRRAATLATLCELDEMRVAGGEPVDHNLYHSRVNVLLGVLNKLGLGRTAKNVTPSGKTIDAHARAILDGEA